jgi:hypothetical protein
VETQLPPSKSKNKDYKISVAWEITTTTTKLGLQAARRFLALKHINILLLVRRLCTLPSPTATFNFKPSSTEIYTYMKSFCNYA